MKTTSSTTYHLPSEFFAATGDAAKQISLNDRQTVKLEVCISSLRKIESYFSVDGNSAFEISQEKGVVRTHN